MSSSLQRLSSYLLAIMGLMGCLVASANPPVSVEGLRAIMQARRDNVSSLYYDCEIRRINNDPRGEMRDQTSGVAFNASRRAWGVENYALLGDKRFFSHQYGPTEAEVVYDVVETWDELEYRRYNRLEGRGIIIRSIEENHGYMKGKFHVSVTPMDLLLLPGEDGGHMLMGRDIYNMLQRFHDSDFLPNTEKLDDSECIVLAHKGTPVFWLDVNRNFALKKFRDSIGEARISAYYIYNESFKEVEPGTWLPTKSHTQWVSENDSDGTWSVVRESVYEFSRISLNEALDYSLFKYTFPKGTRVADWDIGAEYIEGYPDIDPRSPEGYRLTAQKRERKAGKIVVGIQAPALNVAAWVNSEPMTLAALQGKIVVVAFWDLEEDSSEEVVKTLNALAEQDADVTVVAIHTAEGDQDALQRLMEEEDITFRVALDRPSDILPGATFEKYKVKKPPSVYILGADGTVKFQDLALAVVEEAVERVIAGE